MQHFIVLMRKRWYGFALIFAVASANRFVFRAVFDEYVKNLRDKPPPRGQRGTNKQAQSYEPILTPNFRGAVVGIAGQLPVSEGEFGI